MDIYDYLQIIGTLIGVISIFPQLIHIIKTKSMKDFSWSYLWLILIADILMEIYAIKLFIINNVMTLMLTMTISFLFALVLLILKILYKNNK